MTTLRSLLAVSLVTSSLSAFAEAPSVNEASAALGAAQQHLRACQNGKLQLEFTPVLARLESARKSLEQGRKETEKARRALESTRKRIEAAHRAKQTSLAERDASIAGSYVAPLQALSPLVTSYASGIKGYAAVLEQYAQFCGTTGITTSSARTFVSGLSPAVVALEADARTLVADAAKASTSDVAAR